jgi:hypothetical protein
VSIASKPAEGDLLRIHLKVAPVRRRRLLRIYLRIAGSQGKIPSLRSPGSVALAQPEETFAEKGAVRRNACCTGLPLHAG